MDTDDRDGAPRGPGGGDKDAGHGHPGGLDPAAHLTGADVGRTSSPLRSDLDAEAAHQATKKYAEDLLARGEAVEEGEELTPGATHEIVRQNGEPVAVRRKRFSAF